MQRSSVTVGGRMNDDAPSPAVKRDASAVAAQHEELQHMRERMELLSAASFEGLFFHVDGTIFDANQRLEEITGYSRAEILGDRLMRMCVAPEDLPGVQKRMAERFEGAYVITAVRKDGSRFRAELQAKQGKLGERPVRVVAVRDVTERERTQALLRESEERLRNLAEQTFDLTAYSRDGVVVDVVGDSKRVLGYTREQMIGKPVVDFTSPTTRAELSEVIREQRVGVFQSLAVSADGEEFPVEVVAVQATLHGEPVRLSAMRDLRETRRLERERRELELAFERSQRLDSLGVLAGGIAHDFNNLLTVVLGNASLLLRRARGTDDQLLAQGIVDAAQRAANLTAQMLAYAGRAELGPRFAVDLAALARELHALLEATLAKSARVVLDLAEGCVVLGNRATLTQVLMNLLTNASDALAGEPGEICLRVRACTIEAPDARWARALGNKLAVGRYVLLEVSDTGVGMNEATQVRIFEPFFTTKAQGHGLGLAACIGIVTSHGGAILVESSVGRGSALSVLLPAHTGRAVADARPPAPRPSACRRVLVVDDEPLVRGHLRAALEAQGYEVEEAADGNSALASLARSEPCAVLLDMTMPDLSGAVVLQRIRAGGSQVPVILSSGYHDAAHALDPSSYQAFLVKPYTPTELRDTLERVLEA
jgi:two-component system, cell cycle sensor histidine kinase and response regulator CckA